MQIVLAITREGQTRNFHRNYFDEPPDPPRDVAEFLPQQTELNCADHILPGAFSKDTRSVAPVI
jgi:hypothetical protein